ncbi:Zinc finger, DHHC-type containing 24 [Chamberlinius hualienensis]
MAQSRFIVPKNPRELVLFSIMALLVPLFIVWEFGVVLPSYYHRLTKIVFFHILSAAFITMNIVGNVLLVMRTDASGRVTYLPIIQNSEWRYCYDCKVMSPPRSYHCVDCNICILKRNHHCMFTVLYLGCCIGYHNHRYYLVAICYMFIGAVYAVSFQWQYCLVYMGGSSWLALILSFCAPHFSFLLGYISFYGFVVSVINIIGMVVSLCTGYIFLNQLKLVYNGQTQFEYVHKIKTYDLGWKRNFEDVLGTSWPFVWIMPIIDSPLKGKGVRFTTDEETKSL